VLRDWEKNFLDRPARAWLPVPATWMANTGPLSPPRPCWGGPCQTVRSASCPPRVDTVEKRFWGALRPHSLYARDGPYPMQRRRSSSSFVPESWYPPARGWLRKWTQETPHASASTVIWPSF